MKRRHGGLAILLGALFFVLLPLAAESALRVTPEGAGGKNGSDWDHAMSVAEFRQALTDGTAGEYWLKAGRYTPTDGADRTASFTLKTGIALYGGFAGDEVNREDRDPPAHKTILTGDIDNNDTKDADGITTVINGNNSYHVVTAISVTGTAPILDGFISTGGHANDEGEGENGYGGGMYNYDSNPEVSNCVFSGNSATGTGGGGMANYLSSPVVTNCTFSENSASSGGGMLNTGSTPTVTDSTFFKNSATLYGGGMFNGGNSPGVVKNCTFRENSAPQGGGMANGVASPVVTNCTFSENTATSTGHGMYNYNDASPVVTNCIFWGAGGVTAQATEDEQAETAPKITYSVVDTGVYNDTGNTNTDPKLGPLADNGGPTLTCALLADSSALNAGLGAGTHTINTKEVVVPDKDQRGEPRSTGSGTADIGAYQDQNVDRGFVKVTVEPQDARTAGAQWNIAGGAWHNSGETVAANVGDVVLSFKEIPGWTKPENETVTVAKDETAETTGTYVFAGGAGSLRVDITPGPAEARWSLDNATWRSSGTVVTGLATGSHQVFFNQVNDWTKPADQNVNVSHGQLTELEVQYTQVPPSDPIRYVNAAASGANDGTSWNDAYRELRDALAAAVAGDQIWVAAGTYKPTADTDRTKSFELQSGVALYGGFAGNEANREDRNPAANVTTLSGNIGDLQNPTDNSYHVVTSYGVDSTAVLDGFTITQGRANGGDDEFTSGGGMYNTNNARPTVTNCIFSNNFAGTSGGGMANVGSSPTVRNCTFSENTAEIAGDGMINLTKDSPASPTIIGCTFSKNSALPFDFKEGDMSFGGGIAEAEDSSTIMDCTFSDNMATHGGGICNIVSTATISNSAFSQNIGICGGGMYNLESSLTITNCTFSQNQTFDYSNYYDYSGQGGGVLNVESNTTTITNCTFSGNSAEQSGRGMHNISSSLVATNCIFWGEDSTTGQVTGPAIISYSITDFPGTGNTNADPRLGLLADNGGPTQTHALLYGSSALNTGLALGTYVIAGTTVAGTTVVIPVDDQRGVIRPQLGGVDIGAVEMETMPVPTPVPPGPDPTAGPTLTPTLAPTARPVPTVTPEPTGTSYVEPAICPNVVVGGVVGGRTLEEVVFTHPNSGLKIPDSEESPQQEITALQKALEEGLRKILVPEESIQAMVELLHKGMLDIDSNGYAYLPPQGMDQLAKLLKDLEIPPGAEKYSFLIFRAVLSEKKYFSGRKLEEDEKIVFFFFKVPKGFIGKTAEELHIAKVLSASEVLLFTQIFSQEEIEREIEGKRKGNYSMVTATEQISGDTVATGILASKDVITSDCLMALSIADGGSFDLDGTVNGSVVDPAFVIEAKRKENPEPDPEPSAGTGGGGGCSLGIIPLGLLLLALPLGLLKK